MPVSRHLLAALTAGLLAVAPVASAPETGDVRVTWRAPRLRPGDVGVVVVRPVPAGARVEGSAAGQSLAFFPHADGVAALLGLDLETAPGPQAWTVTLLDGSRPARTLAGSIAVEPRQFFVQRLTLPPGQVDLDPDTLRRAEREARQLRELYATRTPERLWRGRFQVPLAGAGPGEGFGARRIINGQPRSPHSGVDYAADRGTPVLAANAGRVALVGDFFFQGRMVAIDHGLRLYTVYFHLERALVAEGDRVDRGQLLGTVGATGRATGPHLHFGARLGSARVDPEGLLALKVE